MRLNRHNRGLYFFDEHALYYNFMTNPKYWAGRAKPFSVSILREPWSRAISHWRYHQEACRNNDTWVDTGFCKETLPEGFEAYILDTCGGNPKYCYTQEGFLNPTLDLPPVRLIERFDILLVLEEFDLSLIVFAILANLPLSSIPYIRMNDNICTPLPAYSDSTKQKALENGFKVDMKLYELAKTRLHAQAKALDKNGIVSRLRTQLVHYNARAEMKCKYPPDPCNVPKKSAPTAVIYAWENSAFKCLNAVWPTTYYNLRDQGPEDYIQ